MLKRKIAAANWKMNMRKQDLEAYFATFTSSMGKAKPQWQQKLSCEIVFSLPTLFLERAQAYADSVHLCAQNAHWAPSGAYTGETSLPMLTESGIDWVLCGHSERRQFFGENDQVVAKKVNEALQQGFKVIACVGETLDEREGKQTEAVLTRQLQAIFAELLVSSENLVIAYEPVWAIGTGLAATAAQAGDAHRFIKSLCKRYLPNPPPVLYGGSVKAQNAKALFAEEHVDGCLVGGASLDPIEFAAIVTALAE